MSCDREDRASAYLAGDLDAAARSAFETHAASCSGCRAALEDERHLLDLLDQVGAEPPPASLLAECRSGLATRLRAEAAAGPGTLRRLLGRGRGLIAGPRTALWPAAALSLLLAGFLFGRWSGAAAGGRAGLESAAPGRPGAVDTIHFVESDPASDRVSLSYETQRRGSLSGSPSDPRIRNLLVDTVTGSLNAGLRLEAIEALRGHADDAVVRAALVRAVEGDDNAGARLKALDALEPRAARDASVRGALMKVLASDTNPGVRVRALDVLGSAGDPASRPLFARLAREDRNDYVRLRSAALASGPGAGSAR